MQKYTRIFCNKKEREERAMKVFRKAAILLLVLLVGTGVFTACGKKNSETSSDTKEETNKKENNKEETNKEETKITALTGGSPVPYIWTNDDESLDGYDIKVFEAVMEKLPQYKYEYEISSDIFTSADAGYGQVIVQHLGSNDERREKYIFSYPYYFAEHGLLVKEGSEIKTWDDLPGHSTEVSSGSFNAILFEKWNTEHPDKKIDLIYTDDANATPLHVSDGTVDFEFFDYISLEEQVEKQGITGTELLRVDNDTIPNNNTGYTYFVFPKDQQKFAGEFDEKLLELIEDGTVARLSEEYLGDAEFAPDAEQAKDNH